mmetsp:Transcript_69297/g.223964  ORF Transcript_69297/g.223964 Transcript_69297/m.223964 type:complete len:228 (+) Transcript_69297:21-704(+)
MCAASWPRDRCLHKLRTQAGNGCRRSTRDELTARTPLHPLLHLHQGHEDLLRSPLDLLVPDLSKPLKLLAGPVLIGNSAVLFDQVAGIVCGDLFQVPHGLQHQISIDDNRVRHKLQLVYERLHAVEPHEVIAILLALYADVLERGGRSSTHAGHRRTQVVDEQGHRALPVGGTGVLGTLVRQVLQSYHSGLHTVLLARPQKADERGDRPSVMDFDLQARVILGDHRG